MSNLKRQRSYSYIPNTDNEESFDKILENINKSSKTRTYFTDKICFLINYCSLIVTLIYNSYWVYIFQQFLPNIKEEQTKNCPNDINWNHYYSTWVIISSIKAIFLLFFARIGVGSEFDCNFFLLAIKMLSSVIPSICFIIFIPYYGVNIYDKINDWECFKLYENLSLFYKWEKIYFIFIIIIINIPIIGALAMALKEYLKSLKEKND
jgi:hypothetical protein